MRRPAAEGAGDSFADSEVGDRSLVAVPRLSSAAQIEPEVAFVLSRDLPARGTPYSEAELLAAIGESRFVLELLRTSYANKAEASSLEILADAYNNLGLLIGPAIPNALERPLETLHVTITGGGRTIHDRDGRHPSGHP